MCCIIINCFKVVKKSEFITNYPEPGTHNHCTSFTGKHLLTLHNTIQPVLEIVQILRHSRCFSDFHILRDVGELKVLALSAQEYTLAGLVVNGLKLAHPCRSDQVPGGQRIYLSDMLLDGIILLLHLLLQ